MDQIFAYLNRNQGALSVVLTAVLVWITAIYAYLTQKMTVETRKMRELQSGANLAIYLKPRDEWVSLVNLVIENLGPGTARNIKFSIAPDYLLTGGISLSKVGFIENGIDFLGPSQKFEIFIGSMIEERHKNLDIELLIKTTYEDALGILKYENFEIKFSKLKNIVTLGTPPVHQMVEYLEKIAKATKDISDQIKRIGQERPHGDG